MTNKSLSILESQIGLFEFLILILKLLITTQNLLSKFWNWIRMDSFVIFLFLNDTERYFSTIVLTNEKDYSYTTFDKRIDIV